MSRRVNCDPDMISEQINVYISKLDVSLQAEAKQIITVEAVECTLNANLPTQTEPTTMDIKRAIGELATNEMRLNTLTRILCESRVNNEPPKKQNAPVLQRGTDEQQGDVAGKQLGGATV